MTKIYFRNKIDDVEKSIERLVGSMEQYIDHLIKDRSKFAEHNRQLREENQQLRKLLVAKFKEANKEIELEELDIRI